MLRSGHARHRITYPLPALWDTDGHERSRPWISLDPRSVLGVSKMRPTFLDHLLTAEARESPDQRRVRVKRRRKLQREYHLRECQMAQTSFPPSYLQDDDELDEGDEDEIIDDDGQEDGDEDEQDEDEWQEEWKVGSAGFARRR